MEILHQKFLNLQGKVRSLETPATAAFLKQKPLDWLQAIKSIGLTPALGDYSKRKLGIFNLLNFIQLFTGVLVPLISLFGHAALPASAWLVAALPVVISLASLTLNYYRKYELALLAYFILYPFFTSVVYINGYNLGVELSFILYGVLAVFFLKDIGYMLFTIAMSMMCYFILAVVLKNYRYQLVNINKAVYLFNQVWALGFIFYGLFLVKKENTGFQFRILRKNRVLHKKNLEIQQQKMELAEKADRLRVQQEQLQELNGLKDKLFSVIAHDLKSPMYALRNLFGHIEQYNLPAEEIKRLVPDIVNDLNYTTSLMDNLLQWAKSQMQAEVVKVDRVDVTRLIEEAGQLLRLQAEAKQIFINRKTTDPVYIMGDKDMINLVLRNLLSNAIKFTPNGGAIEVGANQLASFVEVYVQDSGTGISAEALQKINENNFYSTKGTASESGTGLGLMLCKEFLARNGGHMYIESESGKGSTFSFTLPLPV